MDNIDWSRGDLAAARKRVKMLERALSLVGREKDQWEEYTTRLVETLNYIAGICENKLAYPESSGPITEQVHKVVLEALTSCEKKGV